MSRNRHKAAYPQVPYPQCPPAPYTGQYALTPAPPQLTSLWEYPLMLRTLSDRNATVAQIDWRDLSFTGSAKREPGDIADEETGRMLATARAMHKLAAHLERQARDRVLKSERVLTREMERALRRAERKAHPPEHPHRDGGRHARQG